MPTKCMEGSRIIQQGCSDAKNHVARRPGLQPLDFSKLDHRRRQSETEDDGYVWPITSTPELALIRSRSAGKLKFSPEKNYEFTAEDLDDLGQIGEGAFGTVNKMQHRPSKLVMAVKRILSTMDKPSEKRLLMELDAIMKSDKCVYIVTFYGAIFTEGACLICMELMDTSLDRLYKSVYRILNEQLPEDIIGKIAVATLQALIYLKNNLKIIHRDVKPSNILLDRKGHIKLCDFGIAGQLIDSIARTRDAGCRPYMAPERIDPKCAPGYDVRSDVWSLGITLVEIATGKFPYPEWNSVFDQLQQVVNGDPPVLTPNSNDSNFSLDFINFVNTCLVKDKNARPKYARLAEFPFVKKYLAADVDVASYVKRVLSSMPQYQPDANGL